MAHTVAFNAQRMWMGALLHHGKLISERYSWMAWNLKLLEWLNTLVKYRTAVNWVQHKFMQSMLGIGLGTTGRKRDGKDKKELHLAMTTMFHGCGYGKGDYRGRGYSGYTGRAQSEHTSYDMETCSICGENGHSSKQCTQNKKADWLRVAVDEEGENSPEWLLHAYEWKMCASAISFVSALTGTKDHILRKRTNTTYMKHEDVHCTTHKHLIEILQENLHWHVCIGIYNPRYITNII